MASVGTRSSILNVTIDDFDSVIQYDDPTHWQTPDPSNKESAATAADFAFGTFHSTTVPNASLSLNFSSSAIFIYGSTGPDFGKYQIVIDGGNTLFNGDANTSQNTTSTLFFAASNFSTPNAPHNLQIINKGDNGQKFTFDYLQTTVQVAASNATATNTTVEESDARVTYTGKWGNNTSPLFSGGGSAFTNDEGASVSLTFNGSAIYAFGDTNANHGFYTVTLDGGQPLLFKSVTGCGLSFQTQGVCERTVPNLLFFASYLNESEHKITFTNQAGVNKTFFDLDHFVYTQPSQFFIPPPASNGTNGSATAPGPTGSSPSGNSGQEKIGLHSGLVMITLLFVLFSHWIRYP